MIASVRRAIIGPHHQINYGASKVEDGVPEVQTARSNGQGSGSAHTMSGGLKTEDGSNHGTRQLRPARRRSGI